MEYSSINLPNIDYIYWSTQNEYFSDTPLIQTVRQGLEYAKRGGLITPLLNSKKIETNAQLVKLISDRIQDYPSIVCFSDKELLIIFDLIQGWGGKTGRSPYVRPRSAPARMSWESFAKIYRDSVSLSFEQPFDHQLMLNLLIKLPQVNVSFATKHMFFWTEYGPRREAVPIYDTRIKTLLCLDNNSSMSFDIFLSILKKHSKSLNMPLSLIERALFSFSQNYFSNDSLNIKPIHITDKDINIARELEQKYIAYHSSKAPK